MLQYFKFSNPPYDEEGNESFDICSSFEYGVDDYNYGLVNVFEKYRRYWIDNGAEWFYPSIKSINWDVDKKLIYITTIRQMYLPFYLRY